MIEKVLIIMDPIESINIKKDTTYQLILSAQEFGHEVYYLMPGSLAIKNLKPSAQIGKLKINKNTNSFFMEIYNPITISQLKSKVEISLELNKILEEMISRNPNQWIWTHNRWK